MCPRFLAAVVLAFGIIGMSAVGQPPLPKPAPRPEPKPEPRPEPKAPAPAPAPAEVKGDVARVVPSGPPEFEVRFADDSVVRLILLEPSISITTKYGALSIPTPDIRRVELGFRYPAGIEAKIETAITNLGATAYRQREDASQALMGFKELAVPSLRRAVKSPDAEIKRRAEEILKKLTDSLPAEKINLRDHDLVETTEFTIKGRLEGQSLKARTKYFGEVPLVVAELRNMKSSLPGSHSAKEVQIDAATYASPNNQNIWLDTHVDIAADRPLEVTATGLIDLQPQAPGQMMCGPAGSTNFGGGIMVRAPNGAMMRFTPGALVGRIGDNGTPFFIGANYKMPRPTAGRLFLRIAPSPFGTESTGSYKVVVSNQS
jgi:hypothetical protein